MRLTVLVPSEEYASYAGARIRYGRIAPHLAKHGIELSLEQIGRFNPNGATCEVVLISKCHDAQSLLAGAAASDRGKLVGVDLFDDYFSDPTDSRLLHHRAWLGRLADVCSFALCSTSTLAGRLEGNLGRLPIHVLNDPAPQHSLDELPSLVAKKVADARDSRQLSVAWFGLGDNPYFRVGLADLAAHGNVLGELTRSGMEVRVTVLTNRRALTAEGLSMIQRLPVVAEIREWSEEAERETLGETLVAFLPVAARPFSTAKSLNRAFTALSSGCQVLCAGYPLYGALDPLIYEDASNLIVDLAHSSMRFSATTMGEYRGKLQALASAEVEAERLAGFLGSVARTAQREPLPFVLIHGHSTRHEAHRLVRALGGLSVASPYCSASLEFDAIFTGDPVAPAMLVSRRASDRLLPHVRPRLKGRERFRGDNYSHLADADAGSSNATFPSAASDREPVSFQLATYTHSIRSMEKRLVEAFGPCRTIISETSRLPFAAPNLAA